MKLFNPYFVSVFTAPLEVRTLSAPFTPSHPTLNELAIPMKMVLTALQHLDINKVTGSDGMPVPLLKETADQIAPSLTMLFNKSFGLDVFPGDWKNANIVPIFKKGRRELPPYFPSLCHLQISRALRSYGSTGSYIPPHQSRTTWIFSR